MKRHFFHLLWLVPALAFASPDVWRMPALQSAHEKLRIMLINAMRQGKTGEMEEVCSKAVELFPEDGTWRYNLACALAWTDDKQSALDELAKAVELGFDDSATIAKDSDLKQLSSMPRFKEILARADAHREERAKQKPFGSMVGEPLALNSENTLWDFELSCFRPQVHLLGLDLAKPQSVAGKYQGPAKDTVNSWLSSGEASANFGDVYVNHDGGHSPLNVADFPGLTPVVFDDAAKKANADKAVGNILFPNPLIGNSSMARADGVLWRSLPRAIECDPAQIVLAERLFFNNQSWFYPAHKDFTAENGDLFAVNLPFFTISKGSSGTDQPFIRAFAGALAALPPKTKARLVRTRLLAPTLQVLLRKTLRTIKTPEDYLSGKAHPAVFDFVDLNADAMITAAHELDVSSIPPLVFLSVSGEEKAEPYKDYFDALSEQQVSTGVAVARIARSLWKKTRTVQLSARAIGEDLQDVQFVWRVLRGEKGKVRIETSGVNNSSASVSVDWHSRYLPEFDGLPPGLPTSRVDVGCFALAKGKLPSLPAIYSVYFLPSEIRIFRADGQVHSVDYTNPNHLYCDPLLSLQKNWKDVYRYTDDGKLIGWTRQSGGNGAVAEFTRFGHRVLERDNTERPSLACSVDYLPRKPAGSGLPSLSFSDSAKRFKYTYRDDADLLGTCAELER